MKDGERCLDLPNKTTNKTLNEEITDEAESVNLTESLDSEVRTPAVESPNEAHSGSNPQKVKDSDPAMDDLVVFYQADTTVQTVDSFNDYYSTLWPGELSADEMKSAMNSIAKAITAAYNEFIKRDAVKAFSFNSIARLSAKKFRSNREILVPKVYTVDQIMVDIDGAVARSVNDLCHRIAEYTGDSNPEAFADRQIQLVEQGIVQRLLDGMRKLVEKEVRLYLKSVNQ